MQVSGLFSVTQQHRWQAFRVFSTASSLGFPFPKPSLDSGLAEGCFYRDEELLQLEDKTGLFSYRGDFWKDKEKTSNTNSLKQAWVKFQIKEHHHKTVRNWCFSPVGPQKCLLILNVQSRKFSLCLLSWLDIWVCDFLATLERCSKWLQVPSWPKDIQA